jgi:hypothetical protein
VKHGFADELAGYTFSNYTNFLEHEWFDVGPSPVEVENVPEF